jgi:hypothetical protein
MDVKKILNPTGTQTRPLCHPAHGQSLSLLRCPGSQSSNGYNNINSENLRSGTTPFLAKINAPDHDAFTENVDLTM